MKETNVAVTPLRKGFKGHAPGEVFDLPARAAKLLVKVGRLAYPPLKSTPAVVAVPEPQPQPEAIAEPAPYNTRRLVSNDSPPAAPAKRAYNRRDLTAKE
jgi:hypothetical protein